MGTRDLPDMYALSPRACGPRASGHTYQANPSCPCYNLYMYSVSSGLHGILVLNKIKYSIASEGLHPPDPLLQRFNTEGNSLSKSQICPSV